MQALATAGERFALKCQVFHLYTPDGRRRIEARVATRLLALRSRVWRIRGRTRPARRPGRHASGGRRRGLYPLHSEW
jgi:hypothetical protein